MKIIDKVTPAERDEIQSLHERCNGLFELAKSLSQSDEDLYDKVIKDLGRTRLQYHDWWNKMSKKYNWTNEKYSNWFINFETCEIYLK